MLSWISNMVVFCNTCANKVSITKDGFYCSKCNNYTREGTLRNFKIKKNKLEFRVKIKKIFLQK